MIDFNALMSGATDEEDQFFENIKKRVLVLGNVNEFLANAVITELKKRGFKVDTAPARIDGVINSDHDIRIYLVIMDRAESIKDLLVYLKDIVIDKRKYICILGSKTEIPEIYKFIPPEDVEKIFERPIAVKDLCDQMDAIYQKSKTDTGKKTLLIVDDDPSFLRRTQQILKEQYKVYIANSGANAIMLMTKHRVDLVLLDYEMPIVDGPHVFEMIKNEPELADTPVMFLTSKSDIFSVQNALLLGPKSYIIKTTPVNEFKSIIERYFLEEKAAGRALKR